MKIPSPGLTSRKWAGRIRAPKGELGRSYHVAVTGLCGNYGVDVGVRESGRAANLRFTNHSAMARVLVYGALSVLYLPVSAT